MRKIILILCSLFLGNLTHAAAPTLSGMSGGSISPILKTTPTLFGGLAGPLCATRTNSATCNSCSEMISTATCGPTDLTGASPFCSCNEKRIHDDLRVTFTIEGSSPASLKLIKTTAGKEEINGTGSTSSFTTTWRDLCSALSDTVGTCDDITTRKEGTVFLWADGDPVGEVGSEETIQIKVIVVNGATGNMDDATFNGAYGYSIYPGDEKVYVDGMSISNLDSGGKVTAVRMWFSPLGFNNAIYDDSSVAYQDIPVDTDGNTSEPKITGLTNGETYHFRSTLIDEVGNIGGWASNTYIDTPANAGTCTRGSVEPNPNPNKSVGCMAAGKPSEVLGMLTEDLNCFIATAAYGSSLEPKLKVFRKFRMVFLLQNDWGRKFVSWYYNFGPRAARIIAQNSFLRASARAALWPVYGFANMALQYGLLAATLVFVFLPAAILLGLMVAFNKRSQRAKI